jgi:hypothetical protein
MDAGARLLVSDGCSEMVSVKGSEDEPRDDHRQSTSGGGLAATEAIPFTNPITGNQIKVYVNPKPGTLRGDAETPGRLVRRAPTSLRWRAATSQPRDDDVSRGPGLHAPRQRTSACARRQDAIRECHQVGHRPQ